MCHNHTGENQAILTLISAAKFIAVEGESGVENNPFNCRLCFARRKSACVSPQARRAAAAASPSAFYPLHLSVY
jgi:hypothetical protein